VCKAPSLWRENMMELVEGKGLVERWALKSVWWRGGGLRLEGGGGD